MIRYFRIPLVVMALACSGGDNDDDDGDTDGNGALTEDNFGEQFLDAYCGAGCTADISVVCDATATNTSDPTGTVECDFDADAAADCVDPANWTCEALYKGAPDTYPLAPDSCIDVCG